MGHFSSRLIFSLHDWIVGRLALTSIIILLDQDAFSGGQLVCYAQSGGFGSQQTENCLQDCCLVFDILLVLLG